MQVCFGNMQHDIVVFRYAGYHKSITPGEMGPIPFPSRLPFNRYCPSLGSSYKYTYPYGKAGQICTLHSLWRTLALHNGIVRAQVLGCRFFQEKYRRLLAHGHELLCKELCLVRLHIPQRFL